MDGIWRRKMCQANKNKLKATNDGRNRTAKSRKNQNARRKENLKVLGNIRSGHRQISGDERKKLKKSISGERENYSKPNYIAETTSKG